MSKLISYSFVVFIMCLNNFGHLRADLEKEFKKLYYFIKGGDPNLKQFQREKMFIQMLEGLHVSEAELLVLVKDKQLQKKYRITKAVVEEAFPQIKWGGRS